MNRTASVATIALASALLTPLVVMSAGADTSKAPVSQNRAVMASAPASAANADAGCARRVKVVYAGYGEGQSTRCAAPASNG